MPAPNSDLPKITIVTPSFNQGRYIDRTIQSVLQQEYPNLDYIVIDGGSTDETLSILRRYEGQLRWISEKDSGQSEAINKGFRLAKGEIVAWLNSDDVYLPGSLETVGKYFAAHPEVMMIYGEGYMIDENDTTRKRFPFTEPRFDLWKLIYYGDYILQQSTFFRRSVFDTIDLLGESLHYTMDWDLFIRIGKRFRVDYVPEYFGCIREHDEAKTSTGGARRFREIKDLIRKHGVMKYPLAYFNYMWDAYGKPFAGENADSVFGKIRSGVFSLTRSLLELVFARYKTRLQQGCYSDGWVGRTAMVVLPNVDPRPEDRLLTIEGEAQEPNARFKVDIRVNRKAKQSFHVTGPGVFRASMALPSALGTADSFHVEMHSDHAYVPAKVGGGADERHLAFLLRRVEIGCL
jgi:glycosyltransferase involved in cell wall biosynthesis